MKTGDKHKGTSPRELQAIGVTEDGQRTNRLADHTEIADRLREYFAAWEGSHHKASPTPYKKETTISKEEVEQLGALGYVD